MSTAFESIKSGELALIPTDTVYGFAALPGSKGCAKIFEIKNRPTAQVLPWLVSGVEALDLYGENVNVEAKRLASMFWPGALTLVVKASKRAVEMGGVAENGTIALRCPDNAECLSLLNKLESPLACTSANLHGKPSASRLEDVDESFVSVPGYDELPASCAGDCASTIVDCTGTIPLLLREGPISEQVLLDVAVFGATFVE